MAISFPTSPTVGQVWTAPSTVIYKYDGVKWVGQAVGAAPSMPTGFIAHYSANAIPTGFLKCNGAPVSRATYAALFAVIGTIYGTGDGGTTFNLPDLRGEFIRGFDDGRGIDAGRAMNGVVQLDDLKTHSHAPPAGLSSPWVGNSLGGGDGNLDGSTTITPADRNSVAGNTQATGGTETRPRNVAMLACIKF